MYESIVIVVKAIVKVCDRSPSENCTVSIILSKVDKIVSFYLERQIESVMVADRSIDTWNQKSPAQHSSPLPVPSSAQFSAPYPSHQVGRIARLHSVARPPYRIFEMIRRRPPNERASVYLILFCLVAQHSVVWVRAAASFTHEIPYNEEECLLIRVPKGENHMIR